MDPDDACFDGPLTRLDAALRAGDHPMARLHLAAFDLQLSGYVRGEERAVFPLLEQMTAGTVNPTARMRQEHASLRQLVAALWRALDHEDARSGIRVLGTLRSLLLLHVAKEDWVLYPRLRLAAPA